VKRHVNATHCLNCRPTEAIVRAGAKKSFTKKSCLKKRQLDPTDNEACMGGHVEDRSEGQDALGTTSSGRKGKKLFRGGAQLPPLTD